MVDLKLREIMGLAVAVDDLHIAHGSLDPLLGKLDPAKIAAWCQAYRIAGGALQGVKPFATFKLMHYRQAKPPCEFCG
jgi:hypothetical protein